MRDLSSSSESLGPPFGAATSYRGFSLRWSHLRRHHLDADGVISLTTGCVAERGGVRRFARDPEALKVVVDALDGALF